jgi:hypothetical protein
MQWFVGAGRTADLFHGVGKAQQHRAAHGVSNPMKHTHIAAHAVTHLETDEWRTAKATINGTSRREGRTGAE